MILLFTFAKTTSSFAQAEEKRVYVNVFASEDMNFRADNIRAESKSKSSRSIGKSNGFAEDGNYGAQEVEVLVENLKKKILKELENSDWNVVTSSESNPVFLLQILIVDARNNAPTMNQTRGSGLADGRKEGGATLVARLTLLSDASKIKTYTFSKYDKARNLMTWGGAHQAFSTFSKRVVEKISDDNLELDGAVIKIEA